MPFRLFPFLTFFRNDELLFHNRTCVNLINECENTSSCNVSMEIHVFFLLNYLLSLLSLLSLLRIKDKVVFLFKIIVFHFSSLHFPDTHNFIYHFAELIGLCSYRSCKIGCNQIIQFLKA